jgi:hypothetical protein
MSKPTKNCKAVIWFDMKQGKWFGDADVMREMIKRGLTKGVGLQSGRSLLTDLYRIAEKEL